MMVQAQERTILPYHQPKAALVPAGDIGTSWKTNLNYDDSAWQTVTGGFGGVGYERDTGYESRITLNVEDRMHESATATPNTSCYIRIKFQIKTGDLDGINSLKLKTLYDDGFSASLNGVEVVRRNSPNPLEWNSSATQNHEADQEETIDVTAGLQALKIGENLLAVHALNVQVSSSDFLFAAELIGTAEVVPQPFSDSNLPIVVINTFGQSIPDEPKIVAEMGVIDNGPGQRNRFSDDYNDFHGQIAIELRGSSSMSWPKKQYGLETQNENGENLNVSLLGLPPENDWVLNAPFIDRSFMRNVLIYRLSRELGQYAPRSKFCEVVLNGSYQGVYVLLERIKRDSARVDVSELRPEENTGDDVTGGYIIKVDKPGNDYFVSLYPPFEGSNREVRYQYHYPQDVLITEAQKQYIRTWMFAFEDMMSGSNIADPVNGYAKYIDVDSFADNFLLNEISKNVDGFRLSAFLYKEKDSQGGKLFAGPLWDFNLAFGNANYYDAQGIDGWQLINFLDSGDGFLPPFWWYRLADHYTFENHLKSRWARHRAKSFDIGYIHDLIDAMGDTLAEAAARNFELWPGPGEPGTGFWPVPEVFYSFSSYQDELDFLKDWIAERVLWIDENLSDLADVPMPAQKSGPSHYYLYPNTPNPFNMTTSIQFDLPLAGSMTLDIFDARGRLVRKLLDGHFEAGSHRIQWDGKSNSGQNAVSGIYICCLRAGGSKTSQKLTLLK